MSSSPFKENAVIVTGASAGIGRELALQLADRGAWLSLAARDAEKLGQVAAACRERAGAQALAIPTDVADRAQCKNLIEKTAAEYGRIDTLVNNAGITMWARFDELRDLDVLEKIMQVNYFGSVYCTHFALPFLKKSKGRLVGVSSLAGRTGVPTRSGYAASKHAMAGFFDTLRIELAEDGVTVTMIYPGFVSTEVRKRASGADGRPLGESPVRESEVMTAGTCARLTLRAVGLRKRELVMTARGKAGQWMKLIAPGLVDSIAKKAIREGR
ncbi:MAG: SDR family oxidoreductase [Pseudomonadota bacterium]